MEDSGWLSKTKIKPISVHKARSRGRNKSLLSEPQPPNPSRATEKINYFWSQGTSLDSTKLHQQKITQYIRPMTESLRDARKTTSAELTLHLDRHALTQSLTVNRNSVQSDVQTRKVENTSLYELTSRSGGHVLAESLVVNRDSVLSDVQNHMVECTSTYKEIKDIVNSENECEGGNSVKKRRGEENCKKDLVKSYIECDEAHSIKEWKCEENCIKDIVRSDVECEGESLVKKRRGKENCDFSLPSEQNEEKASLLVAKKEEDIFEPPTAVPSCLTTTREMSSCLGPVQECKHVSYPVFCIQDNAETSKLDPYKEEASSTSLLTLQDEEKSFAPQEDVTSSDIECSLVLNSQTCNKRIPFVALKCDTQFTLSSQFSDGDYNCLKSLPVKTSNHESSGQTQHNITLVSKNGHVKNDCVHSKPPLQPDGADLGASFEDHHDSEFHLSLSSQNCRRIPFVPIKCDTQFTLSSQFDV